MSYSVKEIFYSLQGEGQRTGRAAVFCRFSGCNFWNGLARNKANSLCPFCDTEFVGYDGLNGGKFASAQQLAEKIYSIWMADRVPQNNEKPYIVFTGGEPLLQLDHDLIDAIHQHGFELAVESNGSIEAPNGIDWLSISPKSIDSFIQKKGNELKLLYPLTTLLPEQCDALELQFEHYYLQAIDDQEHPEYLSQTLDYCLRFPNWKLSTQLHKQLNIP